MNANGSIIELEAGEGGLMNGLCRVDFLWIDGEEYFRITFLWQMSRRVVIQ